MIAKENVLEQSIAEDSGGIELGTLHFTSPHRGLSDDYPDCAKDGSGVFKDVFFEDVNEVTMSLEGLTC